MALHRSLIPSSLLIVLACSTTANAQIRIKSIQSTQNDNDQVASSFENGSEALRKTSDQLENGSEKLTTLKLKVRDARDNVREVRDDVREVRDNVRKGRTVLKLTAKGTQKLGEKLATKSGTLKKGGELLLKASDKAKTGVKKLTTAANKLTHGANKLTQGANVMTRAGNKLSQGASILDDAAKSASKGANLLDDSAKIVRAQSSNSTKLALKGGTKKLLTSNPTKTLKLAKNGAKLARAGGSLGVSLVVEDVVGVDPVNVVRDLATDPANIVRSLDPKNVDRHLKKQSKHFEENYLELGHVKKAVGGVDKVTGGALSKANNGINRLTGGDLAGGTEKLITDNVLVQSSKNVTRLVRDRNVDGFLQSSANLAKNDILKFGAAKKIVNGVDTIAGGAISKSARKIDDVTGGHIGNATRKVGQTWNKGVDTVGNGVAKGYNGVKTTTKKVSSGVKKTTKKVGNTVKKGASKVKNAGKKVGGFVKGIFGKK